MTTLKLDAEFDQLIPPLSDSEAAELETSILAEGCRDPIVAWNGVIVDGHNRHRICTEHGVEYRTQAMEFADRDAVIDWMLRNQLGRRNLSKDSFTLLLGTLYNRRKQQVGGQLRRPQNEDAPVRTVDQVAGEFGVGSSTVERAGQHVNNLDTLGESISEEARAALVTGIQGVTKSDVSDLASDEASQGYIRDDIADGCEPEEAIKSAVVAKKMSWAHSLVDDDEWYTPERYIESARRVMGSIDTDPASNDEAQDLINARRYYTIDDSSLADGVEWHDNVWMNPPYSRVIKEFCLKLVSQVDAGNVNQAIILTNNGTDTAWFHALAGIASAICHHKGRIGFLKSGEPVDNNNKGQIFMYIGPDAAGFCREFGQYGAVSAFMDCSHGH